MNFLRAVALLFALLLCVTLTAEGQTIVSAGFPADPALRIVCWSVPDQNAGSLSQIVVLATSNRGGSKMLWQSGIDSSYSPGIRFISEFRTGNLEVGLVERQTGAGSSELDAVGKLGKQFIRLFHADGFQFDVKNLDPGRPAVLIVHRDPSLLDVPAIYRWSGRRFKDDSVSHPGYYQQLLIEDARTLPSDASPEVLLHLSQIAALAGDRTRASAILRSALSRERARGTDADPQTLQRIQEALQRQQKIAH